MFKRNLLPEVLAPSQLLPNSKVCKAQAERNSCVMAGKDLTFYV